MTQQHQKMLEDHSTLEEKMEFLENEWHRHEKNREEEINKIKLDITSLQEKLK